MLEIARHNKRVTKYAFFPTSYIDSLLFIIYQIIPMADFLEIPANPAFWSAVLRIATPLILGTCWPLR